MNINPSWPGAQEQSIAPELLIKAVSAAQAMVWFDLDGTIIDANAKFLTLMGYEPGELLGRHHKHLLFPEDCGNAAYAAFWATLGNGETQHGEFRRRTKSGQTVWIAASYIPVCDSLGNLLRVVKFAHDVTASKTVAADNAGKLAAISQSHAVIEFDLEGRILDANENFLHSTGYARDEVLGLHHSIFVDPSYAASPAYRAFWKGLREGQFRAGEFQRWGRDGRELWFQASYSPVFDSAGAIVKIVKYATDITSSKQHAVDQEEQMNALSKAQAVIEFALDGTVLTANENFLEIFGYSLAEIRGQHHRIFVAPEDVGTPGYAALWAKLRAGEFQSAEYRRLSKNGREIWLQASYNPIFDPLGKPIKIVKFATDVTSRKRALAQLAESESSDLRLAQEALLATEAQFRATIDHAPVGMALMDEDCHLLHVNQALCRFTGYSADELLTMRLAELIPPNRRVISESERELMRSGKMRLLQMERRVICKDGTEAWALLHISEQRSAQSEQVEFIVQVQDITERRQMEQMKSNFVATVSHELRTPLTSIKGALALVLGATETDLNPRSERLLSIALKNCDRLTLLVNDILDLEKISSGQARFNSVDTLALPLLAQAVSINQPYGQEHDVSFKLEAVEIPAWIRVDVERFQQVMSNLMSNAAKFSPEGSVVRINSELRGENLRIMVSDSGPGIPEEFRERIFTPFSQADGSATRKKGGTGLGLNITRQIVERMQGEIGFENREAGGCTFWISFPRVPAQQVEVPKESVRNCEGPPTILHVEDDTDFAEIFRAAFGSRAKIVHARSYEEAHSLLGGEHLDLVVIDWEFPHASTQKLLDRIERDHPQAAVYGLSSRDSVSDPRVRQNLVKGRSQLDRIVHAFTGAELDPDLG